MSKLSSLTKRQQFWLEHLRSCAAGGLSLSVYAAEEGLSWRLAAGKDAAATGRIMAGSGTGFRARAADDKPGSDSGAGRVSGVVAERGGGGKRER